MEEEIINKIKGGKIPQKNKRQGRERESGEDAGWQGRRSCPPLPPPPTTPPPPTPPPTVYPTTVTASDSTPNPKPGSIHPFLQPSN